MVRLGRTIPALPAHDVAASKDGVEDTDFGTREFSTLDWDGNLIGFYTWVDRG